MTTPTPSPTVTAYLRAIGSLADSDAKQDIYCRESSVCFGCGKPKQVGLTVCWDCFKTRVDIMPLKYAGIGLCAWLQMAWRVQAEKN